MDLSFELLNFSVNARQPHLSFKIFFAPLSTEKCTNEEFSNEFVEDGQPLGIDCCFSEILQPENYSLSWYINGNETHISKQPSSRIHQRDNMLWFIPAAYNDSGTYEYIIRSEFFCIFSSFRSLWL
uniref:Ig-like domain-containing protein n=1 Tax=Salvator merianae TaxID=96440 RepID=A0A8D0BH85_SALMN